jgi:hypothetical protein
LKRSGRELTFAERRTKIQEFDQIEIFGQIIPTRVLIDPNPQINYSILLKSNKTFFL